MCIIVVALNVHRRYPFILVSNRDEVFLREAEPPSLHPDGVIAGIDKRAGGTWMGLNIRSGRFAGLTNSHALRKDDAARSRGLLVMDFLGTSTEVDRQLYSGFNLVYGDIKTRPLELLCITNSPGDLPGAREPIALTTGVHAVSNGFIDDGSPKVHAVVEDIRQAIQEMQDADAFALREVLMRIMSSMETRASDPDDLRGEPTEIAPGHTVLLAPPLLSGSQLLGCVASPPKYGYDNVTFVKPISLLDRAGHEQVFGTRSQTAIFCDDEDVVLYAYRDTMGVIKPWIDLHARLGDSQLSVPGRARSCAVVDPLAAPTAAATPAPVTPPTKRASPTADVASKRSSQGEHSSEPSDNRPRSFAIVDPAGVAQAHPSTKRASLNDRDVATASAGKRGSQSEHPQDDALVAALADAGIAEVDRKRSV